LTAEAYSEGSKGRVPMKKIPTKKIHLKKAENGGKNIKMAGQFRNIVFKC